MPALVPCKSGAWVDGPLAYHLGVNAPNTQTAWHPWQPRASTIPLRKAGTGLPLQTRDPGVGVDRAKSASLDVKSWTQVFTNGGSQYGRDTLPNSTTTQYRRRKQQRKVAHKQMHCRGSRESHPRAQGRKTPCVGVTSRGV